MFFWQDMFRVIKIHMQYGLKSYLRNIKKEKYTKKCTTCAIKQYTDGRIILMESKRLIGKFPLNLALRLHPSIGTINPYLFSCLAIRYV